MEHVLVETLVNVRPYQCMLHFELPLDAPAASHPTLQARVQGIRPWLKPEGLLLQGMILEELSYVQENGEWEQKEQIVHFTYWIPLADLHEPNLLNFEIEPTMEQMSYHCVRKDRQVVIQQDIQLTLALLEYDVQESASFAKTGLQKKSGIFHQRVGEVEESLLKIYSVQLPEDYALLIQLSGRVHELKTELTAEGCILDWTCHIHGEYVTSEKKVGTFFFEKKEYFFFPLESDLTRHTGQVWAEIGIPDLALESTEELMVLYRCHLQLVDTCEMHFYTSDPATLPEGVVAKRVEVEQVGQQMIVSQMLEETVDLAALEADSVTQLFGECKEVYVEEVQNQLLLNGDLEFTVTYLDRDGRERIHVWRRPVDQIATCPERRGDWQVEAQVYLPNWAIRDGTLFISAVVDYQGHYHTRSQEWVLTRVPPEWLPTKRERLLVREEIDAGYVTVSGEEKIYLHRYATRILQILGQMTDWQVRAVDGGWMAKGQAELVIYYETGEGERHLGHPFRWYQFIPSAHTSSDTELCLRPEIQVLDEEMLEDGSLLRLRYLIRLRYTVHQEQEEEVVIEMEPAMGRVRPIVSTGRLERQFSEQIALEEGLWPTSRVKGIQNVQVSWRDYEVRMQGDLLLLEGEVEVQIRYQNHFGRERVQVSLIPLQLLQAIAKESEPCQHVRAIPLIKGYDYRLTGHPPKERKLDLSICIELSYRLVGQNNCF